MQINNVNTNFPIQAKTESNNNNKKNTSFKGLDSFCLSVANTIETGGLVVSFTLQDMLGTNLPRPFMGLRRNKEENHGEVNKSFAAKEAVREFLTGPSMFAIPYFMLKAGKGFLGNHTDMFGKACEVPSKFIESFRDIQSDNAVNKGILPDKQEFYKSTFAEMIKNAKGETNISENTAKKAEEFAQRLSCSSADKNQLKKTITNLSEEFAEISKANSSNAVHADFTTAKLSEKVTAPFSKTIEHMMSYADDVVEKTKGKSAEEGKELIETLSNKKIVGRFALNIAMYSAVMGFLQVIPKLYNNAEGKQNAGLKGLMKDATFNDKELNAKENKKHLINNKNKSNPSFGSMADMAKAVTGKGNVGKFADMMEFDGCNVSFTPLAGIMAGGIMYPRVKNAKDKYDKEEIIRRDAITCVVMCVGEKILRKGFSKINEATSGLVLAAKGQDYKDKSLPGKIFDYLKPVNGIQILSSEQIRAKYSNIDKYKDGVKGFCDFISEQGGDLGKLFGLTDKSKAIVNDLLKAENTDIASADNKTITKVIGNPKNADKVKELADLFHPTERTPITNRSFFDKILNRTEEIKDNPWVNKARTLNARFTTLSVLVLVPVFLGFMLPAINEKSTKKRINDEKNINSMNNTNNSSSRTNFDYMNKMKKSPVFADMEKFAK